MIRCDRLCTATAIILSLCTLIVTGCQQQSTEPPDLYRIGIVNPVTMRDPLIENFRDQMAALGYVEGETVTYLYNGALSEPEELAAWAQSLVEQEVDLIFGVTTPGSQAAAAATDTIPVVFAPVTDPIGAGLVDDLVMPGGNVTGVTNGNPHPLRLEILLDIDPDIEVVYAPQNPESPPAVRATESIQAIVDIYGLRFEAPIVTTDAERDMAFNNIPPEADAIFIMPDPAIAEYTRQLVPVAIERGIPLVSLSRSEVEIGALMAYGESLEAVAAQTARMIDKVLQGTDPGSLPVETAEFSLAINLDTAQQIGLVIPEPIIARADYIVRSESDE